MSAPDNPSRFPRLVASNEPGLPQVAQPSPEPGEEEEIRPKSFFSSGNRIVLGATVIIVAAFIATIVFAAMIPINRGSVAPGRIEAQGTRTVIQHLDGGTVERLLVNKGDKVRAGQLLIKLDDRTPALALQLLEEQRRLLLIEQAMLQAERAGWARIPWPAEVLVRANDPSTAQAMRANESLLASRRSARDSEKAVLAEGITRLQAQVVGLEDQRKGQIEQARLIKLEADSLEKLYDQGLTTRTRILALQRSAADLQGAIGTTTSSINQARVQMTESRLRMITIDQDMQREDAKRLQELQSSLFELDDRIATQRLVVERTSITAPSDGIVLERAVNSVGSVVRPGEPILELVPSEKLVVRANVKTQDVDRVRVGARAVVRLSGLNVQTTPRLHGKVVYVSADAITPQEPGVAPYYEARVEVPESELRKVREAKVTPGMNAEVMIDAGARTVLSYLLQPVSGAFGRAFLE
ncbi:MAG TPA: HlyD family type I secretion periplasmic adaptor subunit [Caulobacteraceae bacterium]|jgi:HlyD family type I secretion membrane fusion protein